MNQVARLSRPDRRDLFHETAARMELDPVVVEKDFWVCWLLMRIFSIRELSDWLVFKGGTSLAKCFNLIQRFSEDIDLAVDFEKLGFVGRKDPRQASLSHTKRAILLNEMMTACRDYIRKDVLPLLSAAITKSLPATDWKLNLNSSDDNIVEFEYPGSLETGLDYIRPNVVLELGTHAEPVPHENFTIKPYAADYFPKLFSQPECSVATVVARRTFWEKATILHAEYYRPEDKSLLKRYSRHYADVAQMSQTPVVKEALDDLDLLKSVTIHKDRFYHCGWAKYDQAIPGSFHLVPPAKRITELRRDYQSMVVMYFTKPPTFDEILEQLSDLEGRINDPQHSQAHIRIN